MQTLETLKLGLTLSIIPFTLIFLFLTIAWALVDISLRNLSRGRKALWSAIVVILPLAGAILYNFKVRLPQISRRYSTQAS